MSYDLEALAPCPAQLDRHALLIRVRASAPELPAMVHGNGFASDGEGFSLQATPRGIRLSAGLARGPNDEWLMEWVALYLASPSGEVIDRHTGRRWPIDLLAEWLTAGALFSGRALAINEERIERRSERSSATGFASRVAELTRYAASPNASKAFVQRIHDELAYYATRPALIWPVARGLAALGDFSRLEALARTPMPNSNTDAFMTAAEYGSAALPLFLRALGDVNPNYRRGAARALHLVTDPAVLPLVARALEDKRSTVREAILETNFDQVLALDGAQQMLGPVLARMTNDPSSTVRRLLARWSQRIT